MRHNDRDRDDNTTRHDNSDRGIATAIMTPCSPTTAPATPCPVRLHACTWTCETLRHQHRGFFIITGRQRDSKSRNPKCPREHGNPSERRARARKFPRPSVRVRFFSGTGTGGPKNFQGRPCRSLVGAMLTHHNAYRLVFYIRVRKSRAVAHLIRQSQDAFGGPFAPRFGLFLSRPGQTGQGRPPSRSYQALLLLHLLQESVDGKFVRRKRDHDHILM